MTTRTATPLLDGLVAFLLEDGWPVNLPPGAASTVQTRCAGSTTEWACTGRSFEQQGQVVFDSELPMVVPEDLRSGVALLLARANWSLHTGAFAMDPATGEMRLRTSLVSTRDEATGAGTLEAAAAKALVYPNVLIVDRCMPTLEAAATGAISVTDALQQLAL
jgi:hypothetical protein